MARGPRNVVPTDTYLLRTRRSSPPSLAKVVAAGWLPLGFRRRSGDHRQDLTARYSVRSRAGAVGIPWVPAMTRGCASVGV